MFTELRSGMRWRLSSEVISDEVRPPGRCYSQSQGGVGKTTVAHVLAQIAAQKGLKVTASELWKVCGLLKFNFQSP